MRTYSPEGLHLDFWNMRQLGKGLCAIDCYFLGRNLIASWAGLTVPVASGLHVIFESDSLAIILS